MGPVLPIRALLILSARGAPLGVDGRTTRGELFLSRACATTRVRGIVIPVEDGFIQDVLLSIARCLPR